MSEEDLPRWQRTHQDRWYYGASIHADNTPRGTPVGETGVGRNHSNRSGCSLRISPLLVYEVRRTVPSDQQLL